ncbi:hypothetical protein [Mycolicibacterium neoaurum]|nr:hypothetical protein [Mycolicibacterium neoaurum]
MKPKFIFKLTLALCIACGAGLLLRVSGDLKPSEAKAYETAFTG